MQHTQSPYWFFRGGRSSTFFCVHKLQNRAYITVKTRRENPTGYEGSQEKNYMHEQLSSPKTQEQYKISSHVVSQAGSRQVRGPIQRPPALHQNCPHGASTPGRVACRFGRGPSTLATIFCLSMQGSACRYICKTCGNVIVDEGQDHTKYHFGQHGQRESPYFVCHNAAAIVAAAEGDDCPFIKARVYNPKWCCSEGNRKRAIHRKVNRRKNTTFGGFHGSITFRSV